MEEFIHTSGIVLYTTTALEHARRQQGRAGSAEEAQRSEMRCLATLGELSFEQGDYATSILWLDQANVHATKHADHEQLAVTVEPHIPCHCQAAACPRGIS